MTGLSLSHLSVVFMLAAAPVLAEQRGKGPAAEDDRKALRGIVERATDGKHERTPSRSSEAVRRWITSNGEAIDNVRRSGLADQPWGLTGVDQKKSAGGGTLYLYVFDWHAG